MVVNRKIKITQKTIDNLKGTGIIWDTDCTGLGIRLGAKRHTYFLSCRINGSATKRKIRTVSEIDLKEARRIARDWMEKIEGNVDPWDEEKAAQKAAAAERERVEGNRFRKAAEPYMAYIAARKPKSHYNLQNLMDVHVLPRIGDMPVEDMGRSDIKGMIVSVFEATGQATARKAFELVRACFNWAIRNDVFGEEYDFNPASNIPIDDLIGEKKDRDRVFRKAEIRAFWDATQEMGYPFGTALQLLLMTGQRRSDVAGMGWSELDLEDGMWEIPSERYKTGAKQTVAIGDDAASILAGLPRQTGPHVFSTQRGHRPISGFSKAKARCNLLMKEELGESFMPWTIHDLRRTMRTMIEHDLGFSVPLCESVIGHLPPKIVRKYSIGANKKQKREVMAAWEAHLREILNPRPEPSVAEPVGNVVPIRA